MKKFLISIAAALLLASCGGNGNNQAAKTNDNAVESSAPKQETKVATAETPTAEVPAAKDEPNVYVAASTYTNDKDKKTTIYKNGETLYTHDGLISFFFVVGGHVYYGIHPIEDEDGCKVYADGNATKIVLGPDRRVWKGDKDVFFDDCTGKVFDQNGKTVFEYTADEDGASMVDGVVQDGGNIYVLMSTAFGTEASILYKNGTEIENKAGASECYGLCCRKGDVFFRGFGEWQGNFSGPIICKNGEPVLGGFKPEGSFWISNNGDIYTSEPNEDYDEDDVFTYLNVYKNGKNPKKVKGFPEDGFYMAEDGDDVYYWSFAGALDAYIYKNFVETSKIHYPSKSDGVAHFTSEMKDGHLYAAIVDFENPDIVTLYKDSNVLKAYPAHISQEEGLDAVIADFCLEIE